MRVATTYLSLLFALVTPITYAESLNCVTINSDLAAIEALAISGQYRNLTAQSNQLNFDYAQTRSFDDYLTFASKKVHSDNPKALMKCPIETKVTKVLNKHKSELTVADLVTPFELNVVNSKQAILLIHGLTDSPFLLHDLAAFYHSNGLNVRTLLLPGHGTAPEALIDIEYQQWQQATRFAINKMLNDFDHVYLGGFSTGGALILDNLLSSSENVEKVKGIMLWAPASKAKSSVAWAAQVADWIPFLDYTHKGADIDFAKYESFPLNAGAQVHSLMNELTDKLSNNKGIPDIPLLTVTSEVDTTIDTKATLDLISIWHASSNRKTKHKDTLFYFGNIDSLTRLPTSIKQTLPTCGNKEYCQNITNIAHTAVTNAPSNPHYGWQGNYRNCETSFGSNNYEKCKTTATVLLGETTADNTTQFPHLQRLTFNPNFEQMTAVISSFLLETQ